MESREELFGVFFGIVSGAESTDEIAEVIDAVEDKCCGFTIKKGATGAKGFEAIFELVCKIGGDFEAHHSG